MIKIAISFLLLFTGNSLFAQNKKAFVVKPKALSTASLPASIQRGKLVYASYCLTCHQADGGGVPNLNPPLIQTSYVLGNKDRLINVILNGFTEHVDIDGESYSNNMPPLNALKDQQVADVLTYIRNNFGNKASAVSSAEVQKVRRNAKKK
ncbi:MAG TPA: cytochrome c [Hanamia sp.]|nr:cytochrome c [Hanamia sp.]